MKSLSTTVSAILALTTKVASQSVQRSSGCGKSLPAIVKLGESKNLSIESVSGATPRKYRIHVPGSYNPDVPKPLVFSFHGRNKDMMFQEQLSQFSNASFGYDGIAIYPEGVPSERGSKPKQWQGDPDAPDSINDVTFTLELLDHILDRYCIDPTRVYASGQSNGGGFTGVLACDPTASGRIAAFAAVSGAFYLDSDTQQLPPCKPTSARKTIPFMELHGAKDTTIEYNGGLNNREEANTTSIPELVNAWADRNGFDPNANITGEICSGVRKATTHTWNDTVIHYLYSNMKHNWPSQNGNVGTDLTTCAEADATKVILEWYGKWTL